MEHELSDSIRISVELVLISLILAIVGVLGFMSYRAYNNKQLNAGNASYMQSLKELYWYDNKVVNASDAVELMMTYPIKYTYIFEYRAPDGTLIERRVRSAEDQADSTVPKGYWSESGVRYMVSGHELDSFSATLLTNGAQESVYGVMFTCQEG